MERPVGAPAVWRKGKVRLPQEGALAVARKAWRENLKSLEGKK